MAFAHRVVAAHFHSFRVMESAFFEGNVFGNIDNHRAGASGAGDMKGFLDRYGQVANILDQKVVFDDGACDTHGVAFLESVKTNRMRGHLTGNDHHRDAVHVGGRNAGHGISHARARGHQGHADFTGSARVTVGGVNCGLLMTYQHMLNGVLLVKCVVDVQDSATGVAPDVLYIFVLKGSHQDLGAHQIGIFV